MKHYTIAMLILTLVLICIVSKAYNSDYCRKKRSMNRIERFVALEILEGKAEMVFCNLRSIENATVTDSEYRELFPMCPANRLLEGELWMASRSSGQRSAHIMIWMPRDMQMYRSWLYIFEKSPLDIKEETLTDAQFIKLNDKVFVRYATSRFRG
jgi:hypothetical protein